MPSTKVAKQRRFDFKSVVHVNILQVENCLISNVICCWTSKTICTVDACGISLTTGMITNNNNQLPFNNGVLLRIDNDATDEAVLGSSSSSCNSENCKMGVVVHALSCSSSSSGSTSSASSFAPVRDLYVSVTWCISTTSAEELFGLYCRNGKTHSSTSLTDNEHVVPWYVLLYKILHGKLM